MIVTIKVWTVACLVGGSQLIPTHHILNGPESICQNHRDTEPWANHNNPVSAARGIGDDIGDTGIIINTSVFSK